MFKDSQDVVVGFIFLLIFLIAGLAFYWASGQQQVCTKTGYISKYVEAVGHRYSTSFIYEISHGSLVELQDLYQVGDKVCLEWVKKKEL